MYGIYFNKDRKLKKDYVVKKTRTQYFIGILIAFVWVFVIAGHRPASASDFGKFHGYLAQAYPHYREALFYLRTGNAGVAQFELEQWNSKWTSITELFSKAPPDVYSDDPTWYLTLSKIQQTSEQGLSLAQAGDLKSAQQTLIQIRGLLSELRRSNHVIIFSDHVDAANQAFEHLFEFRHHPPAFNNADQLDAFRHAVSVATHAYRQVNDHAPGAYATDAEFQRLMKQSLYSLSRLWIAIREENQLNLINILREMRSSDRMLFLRFG